MPVHRLIQHEQTGVMPPKASVRRLTGNDGITPQLATIPAEGGDCLQHQAP
jgi:hypothetical protein